MKESEGISQRTSMHNPWTQTTVRWWPERRGARTGWRLAKSGRNGDIYNSVNKNKENIYITYIYRPYGDVMCYWIWMWFKLIFYWFHFKLTKRKCTKYFLKFKQFTSRVSPPTQLSHCPSPLLLTEEGNFLANQAYPTQLFYVFTYTHECTHKGYFIFYFE